jgi:outer membrane protein OmpA-like peptidoglycan-associated protein
MGCVKDDCIIVLEEPKTLIVLADNKKDHNAIIVSNNRGTQRLDTVREFVELKDENTHSTPPKIMSKKKFKKMFGNLMNTLPNEPLIYRLYFQENHMDLTLASQKALPNIMKNIIKEACIVDIIGHTDTTGSEENNLEISFQEANNVKAIFQAEILKVLGNNKQIILQIKGYGENDLLVETSDNQKESKNRYVEIFIK